MMEEHNPDGKRCMCAEGFRKFDGVDKCQKKPAEPCRFEFNIAGETWCEEGCDPAKGFEVSGLSLIHI